WHGRAGGARGAVGREVLPGSEREGARGLARRRTVPGDGGDEPGVLRSGFDVSPSAPDRLAHAFGEIVQRLRQRLAQTLDLGGPVLIGLAAYAFLQERRQLERKVPGLARRRKLGERALQRLEVLREEEGLLFEPLDP